MTRAAPAERIDDPMLRAGGLSWPRALTLAGALAVVVLALYLAHPVISGFDLPIGPDGPVYTWLTRLALAVGFEDAPGGGPGVPALAGVLGGLLGTAPVETVSLLGPVLAPVCGLAAAGMLESLLGPNLLRAGAAALLTAAFTAYLAGGWLANVSLVALFLAALTALGIARRSWAAVGAAAGLLAAAGLAHRLFLLAGLAIASGAVAAQVPEARRQRLAGTRLADTPAVRMAVGIAGGGAAALLGLLSLTGGATVPGDTSQDGFFRRLRLRDLLVNRYRERFQGDAVRSSIPVAAGLGLGAAAVPSLSRTDRMEARFLLSALTSWSAITVIGIAVLAVTGSGPPNRVLQFAFFLPIAAGAGLAALAGRGRGPAGLAILAGVAFVSASLFGWFRQSPAFSAEQLSVAVRAGQVAQRLPRGTSLVFLVDTAERAAAYHVTNFGNIVRMGVPAERIPDTRLAAGTPQDFLAGAPTLTGDREHDAISRAYLREAEMVRGPVAVLVLEGFNPAYAQAKALGTEMAPGVVVLPGSPRIEPAPTTSESAPGLGPAALVLLSMASVAVLALLGGGWARWGFPDTGPLPVAALAPSAGLGVAILGAFAADRLGFDPGGPWVVAAVTLGAVGYAVAGLRRR